MSNDLNLLYEKLCIELEVLENINKIEENKFNLLIKGKLDDFANLNENLESLIEKSNRLENEWDKIGKRISKEFKLNENATLKDIILLLENEDKKKFEEIYEKFTEILSSLKYLSSTNSEMLKNTIKIIDITLSQYTVDDTIDYGKSEKEKKTQIKSMLLNKLA